MRKQPPPFMVTPTGSLSGSDDSISHLSPFVNNIFKYRNVAVFGKGSNMGKATRRKDGRLVKTVTDQRTKKKIYFYGKSEKEINQKILQYNIAAEKGRTFNELSDLWWEETEERLAYQSRRTYNQAKKRADIEFNDVPIKNITPKDISLFLKRLANKDYAQKTILTQKMVINLVFKYAILERDIEYNPCYSIQIPKNLPKEKRSAATSQDEKIVRESAEIWIFPFIAIMTGMRKGEILALQWKDIDFDANTINVYKSVYYESDRACIKEPKTKTGTRYVPLLQPLKAELMKIGPKKETDYIVSDTGEKPLSSRRFQTLMKSYKEQTGITCTAHQLRHSFATIAFECGVPVKSVQEILGHKQLSTTMDLYTDFRKKAMTDATDLLNEKFKNI